MAEERLKLAVFIDFDNIQIGVKDTLGKEFDVSVVLEALKERGEVVTKVAYGDWNRAGEQSRQMTQHAVQLVQRNLTPRGDKNGADINLALDALEMAFNRPHINAFVIVGGDSDFITLVEKLKQYDKRVFVVGGRAFTSNILQRNCHEFIAYENLLKAQDGGRAGRSSRSRGRAAADSRPLSAALPSIRRALKILAEREVSPQVGLLKSTILQLDPTFSERDYGTGSFLEFMQKMQRAGLVRLRRTDRGFLVEPAESVDETTPPPESTALEEPIATAGASEAPTSAGLDQAAASAETLDVLRKAVAEAAERAPTRPIYLRQVNQMLRAAGKDFGAKRQGFRGIVDLLHQAEREGILRLHRGRKGVLRIFPVTTAASSVTETIGPPERVLDADGAAALDLEPAEVDVAWDLPVPTEDTPTEEAVVRETASAQAGDEVLATSTIPGDGKGRGGGGARGKVGSTRRRARPRRKARESTDG